MKTVIIFGDVINRLKKSLNIKSDRGIAVELKMAETTFNGRKKAQSLPFEEIITLAITKKLNIDWLFTGINPVYHIKKPAEDRKLLNYVDEFTVKIRHDFQLVPLYDVEASVGHGALVGLEQKIGDMAFRGDWLAAKGLVALECALIKARGDSMEPTINDGDLLLVDTRISAVKDDAIYVLQTDHHLIVKRVQQSLDGSMEIISDNKRYSNQTIKPGNAKDISVVGRVRWYGHEI